MIEIDYNFIDGVFAKVWDDLNTEGIFKGINILAMAITSAALMYSTIKFTTRTGGKAAHDFKEFLASVGKYALMAISVFFFPQITGFLDGLFASILGIYSELDSETITVPLMESMDPEESDMGPMESLKVAALFLLEILNNPMVLILKALSVVIWLFDLCIATIFVAERFFILLLLKLVGPLAISLAIIPRFGEILTKWLLLYAKWYLVLIPYMVVNVITSGFFQGFELILENNKLALMPAYVETTAKVPILLLLAILKFKLYTSSKTAFNGLFGIKLTQS